MSRQAWACEELNQETFLALPTEKIVEIVQREGRPKVGVFVPDGSRRLVLALTDAEPGSDEFYRSCATLPALYLLESLKVIFSHGLPTLLVPILSRSVLNRGSDYRRLTALEGLRLLFADEEWMRFYDEYGIRVRAYGQPERLAETECAEALTWLENTQQRTAAYRLHTLFYAIGELPLVGCDIADLGVAFWQQHGRVPTLGEQIRQYYGGDIASADFFVMSSKLSGLGAIPRFLVNGDTEVYFLPAAGAMGLNEYTYRLILYDLLYERVGLRTGVNGADLTSEDREALRIRYQQSVHRVIGLGRQVEGVWVPEN